MYIRWLIFGLVLAALGTPRLGLGNSVASISFGDLASRSALIFEGQVVSSDVRKLGARNWIWTCLQFRVDSVLKGTPQATRELCFLGGTLGTETVRVSDMNHPALGERGIFFVERTDRMQANPLLGWDQGRFVVNAAGEVCTAGGKAVAALRSAASLARGLSTGVARGVVVESDASRPGMTPDAFKRRVRELATRSSR